MFLLALAMLTLPWWAWAIIAWLLILGLIIG
jgi:hypothetical protein